MSIPYQFEAVSLEELTARLGFKDKDKLRPKIPEQFILDFGNHKSIRYDIIGIAEFFRKKKLVADEPKSETKHDDLIDHLLD
jgi:hypothetical protein